MTLPSFCSHTDYRDGGTVAFEMEQIFTTFESTGELTIVFDQGLACPAHQVHITA